MSNHCRSVVRLLAAAAIVLIACTAAAALGIPGQRVAADVTVAALPEPLHGFFTTRADAVVERTLEPDGAWRSDASTRHRDDWHYLALDAAAANADWPARLLAAKSFPAQASSAQRLFRDHDIKHGGKLPWELDELVNQLADAFRAGDEHEIVRLTGCVIHFAADAGDPFATSTDRTGAAAGCPALSASLGDRWFAHRDAAQRTGWELIRRNAERYRAQLDPREIRFELGVDDVPFAVIECMLTSFEQLAELCAADRDVLTQMDLISAGTLNADAFAARIDEYYLLLDLRVGETCVQNLRRSVALAATLVVTAWTRAGSPDPIARPIAATPPPAPLASASGAQDAAPAASPQPETIAASTVRFVASRKSKVYHRSDCSHAARIGEANRVEFPTAKDAEAAGKRPCQTCRPEQAEGDAPKNG